MFKWGEFILVFVLMVVVIDSCFNSVVSCVQGVTISEFEDKARVIKEVQIEQDKKEYSK